MSEDHVVLTKADWEEYRARRSELAASHEKRRIELRVCRATLSAWEKAYAMTMDFVKQDVHRAKDMVLILEGMRQIVYQETLRGNYNEEK